MASFLSPRLDPYIIHDLTTGFLGPNDTSGTTQVIETEITSVYLVLDAESPEHGLGPGGVELDGAAGVVQQPGLLRHHHLLGRRDNHERGDFLPLPLQFPRSSIYF